jgi:hypothetical protein
MAQHTFNIGAATTGATATVNAPTAIAGLTLHADAGSQDNITATIVADGAALLGKCLRWNDTGWGTGVLVSLDAVGLMAANAEVDVLVSFKVGLWSTNKGGYFHTCGPVARCLANMTKFSGIGLNRNGATATARAWYFQSANDWVDFGAAKTLTGFAAAQFWWGRMHITAAGLHTWKFWQDGQPEPGTADGSGTSTDQTSGYVGVGGTDDTPHGPIDVQWLSVGTAGDLAPSPAAAEQEIDPTAVTTAAVYGSHVVVAEGDPLLPTAIPTAAVYGAHTLANVAARALGPPTGVGTAAVFGAHTLVETTTQTISPAGIASARTLGSHFVVRDLPSEGVPSAVVYGSFVVVNSGVDLITPTGIGSAAVFGAHTLANVAARTISPAGIASARLVGSPGVVNIGASFPTLFAGLTPAVADGDVVDAAAITNLGKAVTIFANGTYQITGAVDGEWFDVNLFDDSTGDWHVMSPFRVYVNGTIRLENVVNSQDEVGVAALVGQGLTVTQQHRPVSSPGVILEQDPPARSLVPVRDILLIVDSGQNEREARPTRFYTRF